MSQPQSKPPIFGNSPVVFLAVAAGIAALAYAKFAGLKSSGSNMTYAAPAVAGAAAAALILPLVLGVAAYWIGVRSTKAARATACAAALLMSGFGVYQVIGGPASASAGTREFAAAREQQAEAVRSGDTEKLAAAGERTAKAIESSAKDANAQERKVAMAVSKFARELNELAVGQNMAFDAFNRAGGMSIAGIKTVEDLEARVVLLDAARVRSEKFGAAFDGARKELGNRLVAAEASERIMHEVLTGFEAGAAARGKQRELNESNAEFCKLAGAMFAALKTHWGKWSATEKGIDFSAEFPESEAAAYVEAEKVVAEIAVEQNRIMDELAAMIAGRAQAATKP
jgi:ribonuclease I